MDWEASKLWVRMLSDMIHNVPAVYREDCVFVCGHSKFYEFCNMCSRDGVLLVRLEDGCEEPTVMGYKVIVSNTVAGLAFGPLKLLGLEDYEVVEDEGCL